MNSKRLLARVCVSLACVGLLVPSPVLAGAQPAWRPIDNLPMASDVELDADGSLRGVVVNLQGVPVAKTPIVLHADGRQIARTSTDAFGRFSVAGLRGGTYQLMAGRYAKLFRVWATRTAPPTTKRAALVVVGDDVLRGQRPLGEFLCSDCVLCTALVAAAIAIPIALYNSGDPPASP